MKFLLYTVLDIDFYLSHEVKLTASTPQSSLTCFDSGEIWEECGRDRWGEKQTIQVQG